MNYVLFFSGVSLGMLLGIYIFWMFTERKIEEKKEPNAKVRKILRQLDAIYSKIWEVDDTVRSASKTLSSEEYNYISTRVSFVRRAILDSIDQIEKREK